MIINTVRDRIYDLVKEYFPTTNVTWTNQDFAALPLPLVTLNIAEITQNELEIAIMPPDPDTEEKRFYHTKSTLTVNLYTTRDTAINDCEQFILFLKSYRTHAWQERNNISIVAFNGLTEVPGLYGRAKREYRAMFRAEVRYISETQNCTNVTDTTVSGGGTYEQSQQKVGSFTQVNFEEEK